jgi:hypothetical protein
MTMAGFFLVIAHVARLQLASETSRFKTEWRKQKTALILI